MWIPQDLALIGRAEELEIAGLRAGGTLRRWLPIWVVCAGEQVYVRTWQRRDDGWFGHVVAARRARIRVPGVEFAVSVDDVGDGNAQLRAGIDAAYWSKYGHYGTSTIDRMVTDEAAAATLRLDNQ